MSILEITDKFLQKELPRSILSNEQFEIVKNMYKCHAVKYIHEQTNIGIKLAATYYDIYVEKQ